MVRQIIKIDEQKCNGCGLCAKACHEGAIGMVNGKAKLLRDDYCDGLGDCLPACPTNAISFEKREALAYNEEAVKEAQLKKQQQEDKKTPVFSCPGLQAKTLERTQGNTEAYKKESSVALESCLSQWPVQIKLLPVKAPYFDGANLLVAADCTAYAYANFHNDFIKGKITVIGCPKLDAIDYSEKLTQILSNNDIKNITVVRMQVPCCGGIEQAVKKAVLASGKDITWNVVIITTDGKILK
ncbi:MAG: 4Fe-4S binding protein [Lachnospiraceae bacterium]|nr:4Fe-4S binding protein [Lachnospiraceae bacterium]